MEWWEEASEREREIERKEGGSERERERERERECIRVIRLTNFHYKCKYLHIRV